jgi:hypothetical protein
VCFSIEQSEAFLEGVTLLLKTEDGSERSIMVTNEAIREYPKTGTCDETDREAVAKCIARNASDTVCDLLRSSEVCSDPVRLGLVSLGLASPDEQRM